MTMWRIMRRPHRQWWSATNMFFAIVVVMVLRELSQQQRLTTTTYAWTTSSNRVQRIRQKRTVLKSPSVSLYNRQRRMTAASPPPQPVNVWLCAAKRNRQRDNSSADNNDDMNRWYDAVDENATPEKVFWEEMERQRGLNEAGGGDGEWEGELTVGTGPVSSASGSSPLSPSFVPNALYATTAAAASVGNGAGYGGGGGGGNINSINQATFENGSGGAGGAGSGAAPLSMKTIEATLSEYDAFVVEDNWLNDDLVEFFSKHDVNANDDDFYKGAPSLDDQLDDWAKEGEKNSGSGLSWDMPFDEPWDIWGSEEVDDSDDPREGRIKISRDDPIRQPSEFLFDASEEHNEQENDLDNEGSMAREDEEKQNREYLERLGNITVGSERLERARGNQKAASFFNRDPDRLEGFDQMWVSAIDNVCVKNLAGSYKNYGIQFADNFGDWQDGCLDDCLTYTIEEIASFKARQVYEVTGLPCIASRTSFEVEPVPDMSNTVAAGASVNGNIINSQPPNTKGQSKNNANNPRVTTGYRFNDIGNHVDYICDALRGVSEPDRVTRFKTCLCYYDGDMEIFDYGTCDVDLHFAHSLRTFIPVAQAIHELMLTLQLTFGLEYQKWLRVRMDEVASASGPASVKLRDRVLKEGRVLPNDIVDVSAFMDSMVDVNLMDDCAKELSARLVNVKPNKILTVATTGLVLALPMAKYLQVPVVYARKERNVVMADTYIAAYSSKTVGKNRELLVSKSHLNEDDRVLIVDDFLSSGASQEALFRIVSQSGATAVGVSVLLEKVYDSGRQALSGFDVPIHSLCRIASVQLGVIQLMEEEGFDRMTRPGSDKN